MTPEQHHNKNKGDPSGPQPGSPPHGGLTLPKIPVGRTALNPQAGRAGAQTHNLSISERAASTWEYLRVLGRECQAAYRDYCRNNPSFDSSSLGIQIPELERRVIYKNLSGNKELKNLAKQAHIVNHGLNCERAFEEIWVGIKEGIRLTGVASAPNGGTQSYQIEHLFLDLEQRANKQDKQAQLFLKLFEMNPLTGVITAFAIPKLLDPRSSINKVAKGAHPDVEALPVHGWTTSLFGALETWYGNLERLFSSGLRRRFELKHGAKHSSVLDVLEREFYRIWADTCLLVTTQATGIIHETIQKKGGVQSASAKNAASLSSFRDEQAYFPLFPRGKPDTADLETLQTQLIRPDFYNLTNFFTTGFETQRTVRVPVFASTQMMEIFVENMNDLTLYVGDALQKDGFLVKSDRRLKFSGTTFSIQFNSFGSQYNNKERQARISICDIPRFPGLGISVDHDTCGFRGSNANKDWLDKEGVPTVDFGRIDIRRAIKLSHKIVEVLRNMPPYQQQLKQRTKVPGTLDHGEKSTAQSHGGQGHGDLRALLKEEISAFIPLMASVVSSAGFLLGTRRKAGVSHHFSGDKPITLGQFAQESEDVKTALQRPAD